MCGCRGVAGFCATVAAEEEGDGQGGHFQARAVHFWYVLGMMGWHSGTRTLTGWHPVGVISLPLPGKGLAVLLSGTASSDVWVGSAPLGFFFSFFSGVTCGISGTIGYSGDLGVWECAVDSCGGAGA